MRNLETREAGCLDSAITTGWLPVGCDHFGGRLRTSCDVRRLTSCNVRSETTRVEVAPATAASCLPDSGDHWAMIASDIHVVAPMVCTEGALAFFETF